MDLSLKNSALSAIFGSASFFPAGFGSSDIQKCNERERCRNTLSTMYRKPAAAWKQSDNVNASTLLATEANNPLDVY